MDDNLNLQELIDRYLNEEMSEEEISAFEIQVQEDPKLKELLEETKLIETGVKAIEREQILKQVQNISNEYSSGNESPEIESEGKEVSFFSSQWLRVAAAIFLVFISGYILFTIFNTSPPTTFNAYLPFDDIQETNSRGPDAILINDLWSIYENTNYSQCLEMIQGLKTEEQNLDEVQFLKGLCHLSLEEYKNARSPLSKAAESEFIYKEDAIWYLGLTLIILEDFGEAQKVLSRIENSDKYPVDELLNNLTFEK